MGANDDWRELLLFWAKTDRDSATEAYHPLYCHTVDVGMVAREIWRSVLPPAARRRLAAALGVPDDLVGNWIAFLAACHDLGKLSPAFASRNDVARRRIESAGFGCPRSTSPPRHGTITAGVLPAILSAEFGLSTDAAARIAVVVGGHHGVFPTSAEVNRAAPPPTTDVGKGRWADVRLHLVRRVADTFGVPRAAPIGRIDNAAAMVLAGLVSVADWIGSNTCFFPYAVPDPVAPTAIDPTDYAQVAEQRARDALDQLGWAAWSPPSGLRSFRELFPEIAAPNDVQQAVVSLAESVYGPSLFIVEVPTGEGKTEAALYLSDRWGAALGQRGCYVALPTQATSNQMFSRVRNFLAQRYAGEAVDLQLLHGHADLSAEFEELRRNGDRLFRLHGVDDDGPRGGDGATPSVVAAEWFTHRKRGLLAPFGVGTVDQGLLAVLQTRHVFVRLFGLAHKTVIVDEVHAYDAYMSTLLEGLLEWLGALGSSVVLLSATLPRVRRELLANAYARGLGAIPLAETSDTGYPRVTWVTSAGAGARHVETSSVSTKTIQVTWVDGEIPPEPATGDTLTDTTRAFPLGDLLRDTLAGGGCAAVICNTVRRAQETYLALKPYFPGTAGDGEPELGLLHARYLFADRDRREKQALLRFGKPATDVRLADGEVRSVQRPFRAVLVATQIIEQSLDLDFDLMVTDPAPGDLVLQRCGRLHRHARERPAGLTNPTLWVRRPELLASDVPRFDDGTAAVYDCHVLLRSWLALKDRVAIAIPGDVEALIESVYDGRECPEGANDALHTAWEGTREKQRATRREHEQKAMGYRILPPTHPDDILEGFNRKLEEDDPDVHPSLQALTRLTDLTVSVVLLTPEEQRTLDPRQAPGIDQTRALLGRSMAVSGQTLVHAILAYEAPAGWRKSSLLRRHRLIELRADGPVSIGGYRLTLDDHLGLVVTRLEKGVK